MRILLTNNTLAGRAGTELYVRDLAIALMNRGHFPVAYSTALGEVAEELRRATVPVIDDLAALAEPPDLIHGQHHLETMTAVLRFPDVPAVYACHGWLPWEEQPPVFPSLRRYVAVDELCRERLLTTPGIAPEQIEVIYNFVDLQRFSPRSALPPRPARVAVFGNYDAKGSRSVQAIRAACRRFGVEHIDVLGAAAGNAVIPEQVLASYDLVFAKARCALEAMATGCAVILAHGDGLGGYVSTDRLARLRGLNFGVRAMQQAPLSEAGVLQELERYDAADAARVSAFIRVDADMEAAVDRWLGVYAGVLTEAGRVADTPLQQRLNAASDYVRRLAPLLKASSEVEARARVAEAELGGLRQELERLETELARRVASLQQQENASGALAAALERQRSELGAIHDSPGWRLITAYRRLRRWILRL